MAKKESRPYLTHDLGARNDPKLMALVLEMGGQGKAIWWDLVEMLWEQEGYLPMNFKVLSFDLRYCTPEDIQRVVTEFNLFENDGERFWNVSALSRIQHKTKVSEQKRGAALVGVALRRSNTDQGAQPSAEQMPSICSANAEQMLSTSEDSAEQGAEHPSSNIINIINIINKYNKLTNQDKSIYTAYAGEDIESFLIIFHFEKNSRRAAHEVARFLAHYSPTNWMIGGQPVMNKEALARRWTVEDPQDRAYKDEKPLQYLKAAYINARKAANEERFAMVAEVRAMESSFNGQQVQYTYACSEKAQQLIMKFGPQVEGFIIRYTR